jgi:hypothetical protein
LAVDELIHKFIGPGRGRMIEALECDIFLGLGLFSPDVSKAVHQIKWHPVPGVDDTIHFILNECDIKDLILSKT